MLHLPYLASMVENNWTIKGTTSKMISFPFSLSNNLVKECWKHFNYGYEREERVFKLYNTWELSELDLSSSIFWSPSTYRVPWKDQSRNTIMTCAMIRFYKLKLLDPFFDSEKSIMTNYLYHEGENCQFDRDIALAILCSNGWK